MVNVLRIKIHAWFIVIIWYNLPQGSLLKMPSVARIILNTAHKQTSERANTHTHDTCVQTHHTSHNQFGFCWNEMIRRACWSCYDSKNCHTRCAVSQIIDRHIIKHLLRSRATLKILCCTCGNGHKNNTFQCYF